MIYMIYWLDPIYDGRKSFYGKAIIEDKDDRKVLISYGSKVAKVVKGKITLNEDVSDECLFSQTTTRHLKEFIRQTTGLILTTKQLKENVEREVF